MTGADQIMDALEELRSEIRALRAALILQEIRTKNSQEVRLERRNFILCQLARATGLDHSMPRAQAVAQILCGKLTPPAGTETILQQLRRNQCPKSARHIHRIISQYDINDTNDI